MSLDVALSRDESDKALDELLRAAAEACADTLGVRQVDGEDVLGYLRRYYKNVTPEELTGRGLAEVYGPALAHRRMAELRPQGRALVRVHTPTRDEDGWETGRSVVQIVTDDMPYLVDSVTAEIDRHGIGCYLVVHPQPEVRRDVTGALLDPGAEHLSGQVIRESWMYIEIDRQPDPARCARLEEDLQRVLLDVRSAVEDADKMRALVLRIADDLTAAPPPVDAAEVGESADLLRWLADGHFLFLGSREYRLSRAEEGEHLSAVPGTGLGILRADKAESDSFAALSPELRARARDPRVLIITKANSRSTVSRPNYLDYVGVKVFSPEGDVIGERRFLGLFTHTAYSESITRIPVLRRKLAEVLDRVGIAADSHDGKDLIEILDTYPRSELFQTSVDHLVPIALGLLRLRERKQVRLFLRRDDYGRYISCLIFLPRDRYTTKVRVAMQRILLEELGGTSFDYSAVVGESMLARLHVVVRGEPDTPVRELPENVEELEARLAAAARIWEDDLAAALQELCGDEEAARLIERYGSAFPEGYKADFSPYDAVADIKRLERLSDDPADIGMNLYRPEGAAAGEYRFALYRLGAPISLSRVLPLLQRMGVEVVDERPYEITRDHGASGQAWIYDFGLRFTPPADVDERELRRLFHDAFAVLWRGDVECDGFNALVLAAGLTWEEAEVLRAYARYLRQAGTTFSQEYIERALLGNVRIARLLVRLFEARFDPRLPADARTEVCDALNEEILASLDDVASLDEDRILRAYLEMINATLRTNVFQPARADGRDPGSGGSKFVTGKRKPYISLKFDPQAISVLPQPRPKYEIFVYSPRVEGVHLRFGKVARGGLRWSDRMEDFRTEILGLVKAQMVKNTVIVPTGSKGGFVVKRPVTGGRDEQLAEGIACYRQFISGMLDLTDNLVGGRVTPPADTVRHDGDDPYLVVAADKGTATFSDIANEVAREYGFWLGDAFASGGSVGYDHKAMGITARGAWESVKFHFRTMGIDVQTTDFTVVGIGDMSGDVFGNGMLQSEHIKLIAAFDHRHIFVDPSPDPARSYAERLRLFRLPRSSWDDYDRSCISPGGGVWPRTAKSIPVSPQMRSALGLPDGVTSLTPNELISAILRAPVDLLWNGGIGTFVKATAENNADVGDKANDAVRVNASELRCKVVGEGGNLGFTQLGRIEYALGGGLINTDFIDNSAGVDTSDHEVNIKILLDEAVRDGEISAEERDRIFLGMTDEVARLVLEDNYAQNLVLAAARAQAPEMLHVHTRYLRKLERDGLVDRKLESLPSEKALAERRQAGLGLTGPEFAVLLAYTKLLIDSELLQSDIPDEPYLESWLVSYFPSALRERFRSYMDAHPLRREIITTRVVNDVVNFGGTTFLFRFWEETGASTADIVRAYLVTREVFDLPGVVRQIQALDNKVDTATQLAMLFEARKLSERGTRWLLVNRRPPVELGPTAELFAKGARELLGVLPSLLVGRDLAAYEERRDHFIARGVPKDLAERIAVMVPAYSTFDLVEIAAQTGRPLQEVAEVYFALADRLELTRLRERVIALPRDSRWSSMARSALRDDLYAAHAVLTRQVLTVSEAGLSPEERLDRWTEANRPALARMRQTISEIWESGTFDLATLSVALRAVRTLVTASDLPYAEG
ncbi:NAD-glutamate dehydrogenase [Thermobispora bispora]|uniref:NAD-glutamate dehydrogenase n=1 Tax=Thermobispora bispora (strain ATCC 19993 / DSM 43833 / CBS 139.67 / JCM 10125 / KCTC 9307 / NBRC 14880 / R51) TaxID=469371 RepID=D6Y6E1_THEBD|nr:NAD-glutamate dehydrogenase [Thermobispora bispora]ADG87513.1 NAD-glutamate dehydrogenase [Thermobispora bispora DSM 43833]